MRAKQEDKHMKDTQIIALYEARDESAIKSTSEKYGDYCYSIAYRILSNDEDSKECVNDTWFKTWNLIPPQKPQRLSLFLGKITRNLSIDRWRANKAARRGSGEFNVFIDEIAESIPDRRSSVEDEVLAKELGARINTFLSQLKEKDRNIFLGRYFYFKSTAQLSKEYSTKESNILLILSRTRKKLKDFLED